MVSVDITVKDFLSKAWSRKDEVAIVDCNAGSDQKPQHMAVMTARESWGDYLVDMFNLGADCFGHNKCLHLYVYKEA